jgi:predicted nuclease with RNAse H fold
MEHKMHTWEPLPLPSEAWIQWQLRNLGYELRCHGLDMFPTNSVQLRELLYRV